MKLHVTYLVFLILVLGGCNYPSKGKSPATKMTADEVIEVALPSINKAYPGSSKKPSEYTAYFEDGIWTVSPKPPKSWMGENWMGGGASAEISDSDGTLLRTLFTDWFKIKTEYVLEQIIPGRNEYEVDKIPAFELYVFPNGTMVKTSEYNPHDNKTGRQCWDYIWEQLSWDVLNMIRQKIASIVCEENKEAQGYNINHWEIVFLTVKPDVCWKALILTIKEIKDL